VRSGDVVILLNLPAHRSSVAASILKDIGAWFLFLSKYSPDLNPIEMAVSKLKGLIRKVAVRPYDARWRAVGNVCSLFTQDECYNFFRAAGYDTN
jgi:transposase